VPPEVRGQLRSAIAFQDFLCVPSCPLWLTVFSVFSGVSSANSAIKGLLVISGNLRHAYALPPQTPHP